MDYLTCRSVAFADLFDNLIRTGSRKAGNNTNCKRGQGISGGEVRHVDVHGGQTQQAAKGAADGQMDGSHLFASGVCLTAVAAR